MTNFRSGAVALIACLGGLALALIGFDEQAYSERFG